jgi:hypothetical protein
MTLRIVVPALVVLSAAAAEKPRIFITESGATQLSGEASIDDTKGKLNLMGGTSPQNVEVMKGFSKQCPGVTITSNRDKADFIVRFDRDEIGPVTPFVRGNKVAVFNKGEDLIYSNTSRFIAASVKGACDAILKGAVK